MRRRQVLAALPATVVAGCLSGSGDGGSGTADGRTTTEERTPPDGVELVEFTHPEYLRATRENRLGAVVRNAGDASRSGAVTLELSPDRTEWRPLAETTYDLAPGEQAIVETRTTTPFVGSLSLRLRPFARTARVESTDPSLDYGDPVALPNGIDLVVGEPSPVDSYEYGTGDERRTATPPDGQNWYLATVTAENRRDEPAIAPYRTALETYGYDWREAVRYRAGDAYEGGDLGPGESRTGGVLFEHRHRSAGPIRLRHPHEGGTVGATWSAP